MLDKVAILLVNVGLFLSIYKHNNKKYKKEEKNRRKKNTNCEKRGQGQLGGWRWRNWIKKSSLLI